MSFLSPSARVALANGSEFRPSGKRLSWKVLLLLPIVAGVGYWFLTHGYQSRHVQFNGGFSSTTSGMDAGDHKVFAIKGQKIRVEYDVKQIKRGRFYVLVWNTWQKMNSSNSKSHYVTSTGEGYVEMTANETGFYKVVCDGSPDGRGYDVTYTASWKVR